MFTGTYTAIVTPFKNGQLDEACPRTPHQIADQGGRGRHRAGRHHRRIAHGQLRGAHLEIIALSVKFAAGKIKVLAGTGANSTSEAVYLTQEAEKSRRGRLAAGRALLQQADAGRVVPAFPGHRPRHQVAHHALQHSRAVAAWRSAWTRCTGWRADCKNIVGIKEAGGSCDRVSQLRAALGPKFEIMCGDDSLTLPFMSVGANGVISVASNVIPARGLADGARVCDAADRGRQRRLHAKYYPLFKDLFIETNPAPVKAALAMMS